MCPGCQYAEWHPRCTSVVTSEVDDEGKRERVDLAGMPREESDLSTVTRCGYVDLSVAWIDDADWPHGWTCPDCGGTESMGYTGVWPKEPAHAVTWAGMSPGRGGIAGKTQYGGPTGRVGSRV